MPYQQTTTGPLWYVKSQGAVRGPFSESALLAMREAGRLAPDTLISAERQDWKPISVLGASFAPLGTDLPEDALPVPESNGHGPQFYIHLDGQTIGPFSPKSLQERILAGALGPTDPVWMQGSRSWLPAARIPGLSFPVKRVSFSIWLKRNAIVLTVVLSATLALIIAPTWYVLALNANRETRYKLQNTDVIGRGESSEVVNAAVTDSPQDFLNQNRQELFDLVHPQGIAKRVIVHDVEFKWKHGRATHRTEDVEQVVVTFTLYWEGPVEKDGFTKMRMTYDNESKRWISTEVLSTNGFTKKDVGEVMVGLMGFAIDKWVQYQAEKAAAQ